MTTSTYQVMGMTCQHCVTAVEEELRGVAGVEGIDVHLVPDGVSTVTVTSGAPLSTEVVGAAVEEAGYELASTRE